MTTQTRPLDVSLAEGDITKTQVEAIVNAANSKLIGGGGVDGAIRSAGGAEIEQACSEIRKSEGGCPTGKAVITPRGKSSREICHSHGWTGMGRRQFR